MLGLLGTSHTKIVERFDGPSRCNMLEKVLPDQYMQPEYEAKLTPEEQRV